MFFQILSDVLGATSSVLTLSLVGIYLTNRKALDKELNQKIAQLLQEVFLPCVVFSSFVKSFDPTNLHSWVPVCLMSCFMILHGFAQGYYINKYFIKDVNMEAMVILATGLSHTTNIQLALVFSLKDYLEKVSYSYYQKYPDEIDIKGENRAVNFIVLFQIVNNLIRWTVAKQVIIQLEKQRLKALSAAEKPLLPTLQQQKSKQSELETPKLEVQDEELQVKNSSDGNNKQNKEKTTEKGADKQKLSEMSPIQNKKASSKLEQDDKATLCEDLKNTLNPPLLSSFLAIIIVFIPALRDELRLKGSFLNRAILNTAEQVGRVAPPLVLLTLGSNLYLADRKSKGIDGQTLLGITFSKLILLPLCGSLIVIYLVKQGILDDPVQVFIIMVTYAAPSANNLLILSTIYTDNSNQTANILLFSYFGAIFTLPIIMFVVFQTYLT